MEIGRIPVITDTLEVLGQAALPITRRWASVFPLAILAVSTPAPRPSRDLRRAADGCRGLHAVAPDGR
jgi:hypothetical protein